MNDYLKQLLRGSLIMFWMIIYWVVVGLIPKCSQYFYETYHAELFHLSIAISIILFVVLAYIYYQRTDRKAKVTLFLLGLPYFLFLIVMVFVASNLPRITDLLFIIIGFGILVAVDAKNSSSKQKIFLFVVSCILIVPLYYFIYDNIYYYASRSELKANQSLGAFNLKIKNRNGDSFYISDFRGKTVCVDMWASSCGNCISSMPEFEKLHQKFKGNNDYRIISLYCPIKEEQTFEWFKEYIDRKFDYDIDYYYIDYESFKSLNIWKFPEFLIVSKESNLVYRGQISYLPYVNDNIYSKLKSINENN